MKPSVYIETSVISALVDERSDPASKSQRLLTQRWWDRESPGFELFYGAAVLVELERSPFPGQKKALAVLEKMEFLPFTDEINGVASVYQKHLLMPQGTYGDAVHLATACIYKMDYLLTWNCRHLANTNKIQHIQTINLRLGLVSPVLLTPEMLVASEENYHEEE
jgi:predicted nucleic acid-binding protein